jgi:hypothetical protein
MGLKYVVTVHGINTDGMWQETVSRVLLHHFESIPISYRDYRHCGVLRLIFEPYFLVAGFAALLLALLSSFASPWPMWIAGGLIFGAVTRAIVRRGKMVRWFKREIDPLFRYGGKVYGIAHSLGTYLLGMTIRIFPDVRFERVVLTGCVLPQGFPWHQILAQNPYAFREVRNEVNGRDPVGWALYVAQRIPGLLPGLGYAGLKGFRQRTGLAHSSTLYGPCQNCAGLMGDHVVHNVAIPEFTHSDAFIGEEHARTFWLPFLWGLDPGEYQKFLSMCELAADFEEQKDWIELRKVESEFLERPWRWSDDLPLQCFIAARLASLMLGPAPPRAVADVGSLLWQMVELAKRETKQDTEDQRGEIVRALRPRIAVLKAIDARP